MTGYGVKIIGDDVLPEGLQWMYVKMSDGGVQLWLARSSAKSPQVLAEVRAASPHLKRPVESLTFPRQRGIQAAEMG